MATWLLALALTWVTVPIAASATVATATALDNWQNVVSTKLGYRLRIPAGLEADVAHYPHARPDQTREITTIIGQRAEYVRLDVFDRVDAKDVSTWVRRDFGYLLENATWRDTRATTARVPAVELQLPYVQAEPQTSLFFHAGPVWCRLTLVASSHPDARRAYALAAQSFVAPKQSAKSASRGQK